MTIFKVEDNGVTIYVTEKINYQINNYTMCETKAIQYFATNLINQ